MAVFRWCHGGERVYVASSALDNWRNHVQLQRRESGVFQASVEIDSSHQNIHYKFIVDGTWRVAGEQVTTYDAYGHLNNAMRLLHAPPTVQPSASIMAHGYRYIVAGWLMAIIPSVNNRYFCVGLELTSGAVWNSPIFEDDMRNMYGMAGKFKVNIL